MDGGVTFQNMPWGGDNHDIWFDPKNADHFALTNDADARLTTSHGKSFTSVSLPNGQMYHVAVDNQIPYWIYGNRQDNGTRRGPGRRVFDVGSRPRRVRVGVHAPRPDGRGHRMGIVLRQPGHALEREDQGGAVGESVAPYTRLAT